jgi:hypothetical protein
MGLGISPPVAVTDGELVNHGGARAGSVQFDWAAFYPRKLPHILSIRLPGFLPLVEAI